MTGSPFGVRQLKDYFVLRTTVHIFLSIHCKKNKLFFLVFIYVPPHSARRRVKLSFTKSWTNEQPESLLALYVISGAGAKYHFVSRVRPLFLCRHHGSHARSRVSYVVLLFGLKMIPILLSQRREVVC